MCSGYALFAAKLDDYPHDYSVTGYTACKLLLDGRQEILRAISTFMDDGHVHIGRRKVCSSDLFQNCKFWTTYPLMFSYMSWLGPLASLLIFLVAFCNPVLLPLLPQAKLLAFPGHNVVTQPVVSSIHNEQLVECSTSPLKNVATWISVTSLYMGRQVPGYPCLKNDKIGPVLVSLYLWSFYYLPSTVGGKWNPWSFYTGMKDSIHPVEIVTNDWTLDSLDVIINYATLFIVNTITAVMVSTVTERFKHFVFPYSLWTCHDAIRTYMIWSNVFPNK